MPHQGQDGVQAHAMQPHAGQGVAMADDRPGMGDMGLAMGESLVQVVLVGSPR